MRPIAFEAERRMVDYTYDKDKDTSDTCSSCHSIARVLSERRTKQEWELLVAMHRGYYPLVDNQPMNSGQGFRRTRAVQTEPGPDGRPPDNRHPMDKVLEHLTKSLPLNTSEWSGWSAAMQPPKLLGRWTVTGTMAGQGRDLRPGHRRRRSGDARRVPHRDAIHRRAHRRNDRAVGKGARLHRLPVAGPRLGDS